MKFSVSSRSLRLQFLLSLMLIGSPVLIIAISVIWVLQASTDQFGEISRELTYEIRPAINIQLHLGAIKAEIGHYLLAGDEGSRRKLQGRSALITKGLKNLSPEYFEDQEERAYIAGAREKWDETKARLETILKATPPTRIAAPRNEMASEFSQGINDAIAILDRIHGEAAKEIAAEHRDAERLRKLFILFALILLVLGLVIVMLAAYLANRALFVPIERLRHAGERFAAGDLGFRLSPERSNEFQALVSTFNEMAKELASQRQQLQDLAIRDGLTGLYNHTEFGHRLTAEWANAERRGANLALIMLDLDHFKAINDTHGHLAGDLMLRCVSETLGGIVRPADIVARYGGEEFAVLLPGSDPTIAKEVASRIQRAIRESRCQTANDVSLGITASIGVANKSALLNSPDHLLRAADEALYQAKRSGRDRIRVYPEN